MASGEEDAPLERAVMYMFGYVTGMFHEAIGLVAENPHALPVPVVFDGGLFDQAAGDLGIELNSQWHLLELKRTRLGVAAEKDKERTEALLKKLGKHVSQCEAGPLILSARESHWFAYASRRRERHIVSYADIVLERYVEALLPGYFGNELPLPPAPTLAKFLFDLLPEGTSTGMGLEDFAEYVFFISGSGGKRPDPTTGVPRDAYFVDLREAGSKLVIAQLNAAAFYQSTLAEFIMAMAKAQGFSVVDTSVAVAVNNKTMEAGG